MHAPITSAIRPRTAIRSVAGVIGVIGITLATGAWTAPPAQTNEAAPVSAAQRQAVTSSASHGPSDDDLSTFGESRPERLASEPSHRFGDRDRHGDDLSEALEQYRNWKAARNDDNGDDPYGRRSEDPYGQDAESYRPYGVSGDPYGHKPEQSPTTSPTPRPRPTATKTARPSPSPTARPTLPVTGGEIGTAMLVAMGLGAGGVALRVAGRRRSHRE